MIQINQATKKFDEKVALSIDQVDIREGECVGIVGNNGAGKTTLFRSMLDLLPLDVGEIQIDGQPVAQSDHWKGTLNAFIDESFLIEFLRPSEYLEFVGKTLKLSKDEIAQHLHSFSDLVNEDITSGKKLIRDLSAGSKVRVGLLAAFLGQPRYILLDEPFAHLDPSSQAKLRKVLLDLRSAGKTIILSSHNLQNVLEVCSRVLLIESGLIKEDCMVDEAAISQLDAYFAA